MTSLIASPPVLVKRLGLYICMLEQGRARGCSTSVANRLIQGYCPKHFSRLKPSEIEDCLCIFKDELHDGTRSRASRRRSGCAVAVRFGHGAPGSDFAGLNLRHDKCDCRRARIRYLSVLKATLLTRAALIAFRFVLALMLGNQSSYLSRKNESGEPTKYEDQS